jgi:fructuronate reductase
MSAAVRLSPAKLATLPTTVTHPRYLRHARPPGVVHLGIGAFHRAHQAVYFDALLQQGRADFAVMGASLRQPDVAQQMGPQDGLYGVLTLSPGESSYQVIGAVQSVCVAPAQPQQLIIALAAASTQLVTLTITEKGYCQRPSDGSLDLDHPDIRHDLAHPDRPRSALGYLAAGLALRRAAGIAAPTLLSCDNVRHNGALLRQLLLAFIDASGDAALAAWTNAHLLSPSTMVDRIVPATTADDRAALSSQFGIDDHAMVKAEPFSQWVIEAGSEAVAPLAEVGALLVSAVAPFETMKLRLLNGSHSTLAYLGYLAGCEFVADAIELPGAKALIARLMRAEVSPGLQVPAAFSLQDYQRALIVRFRNHALRHRTWQIAMDGSQKLPQRLLEGALFQLRHNGPIAVHALAVAAWMRYVGGIDERGQPIDVSDPMAARLAALSAPLRGDATATVDAFLGVREVFSQSLAAQPRWRQALIDQTVRLRTLGARGAIARFEQDHPDDDA